MDHEGRIRSPLSGAGQSQDHKGGTQNEFESFRRKNEEREVKVVDSLFFSSICEIKKQQCFSLS